MPRARKPNNAAPKAQRVDLQQSKAPIPAAGNNLPYGQKQQIEQAVADVPLAEQAPIDAALAAAPPQPGGLTRPTERPTQPITAGLSTGPGPGPEILPTAKKPKPSVAAILTMMADQTDSPDIAFLAYQANRFGV